jgi:PKHD-type hydroxylase
MRDRNKTSVIPAVFTPEECEQIIATFRDKPMEEGTIWDQVAAEKYQSIVNVNVRRASNYVFPDSSPETDWIRERMDIASRQINSEWYEFNLSTTAPDRIVFVHYPLGGFFGPHVDNLGNPELLYKKLTCIIQLSKPDSYEGGNLRIAHESEPAARDQGAMICFPTYVRHLVEPVTSGERFVLINWCVSETHFQ